MDAPWHTSCSCLGVEVRAQEGPGKERKAMMASWELATHVNDHPVTLAQAMARWVGRLLKGALMAGRTERPLPAMASEVGPCAAEVPPRRAPDE